MIAWRKPSLLVLLIAPYPLWWALGLGVLIFPLLAVPMAICLCRQHARWRATGLNPVRLPPGFLLWLIFCATLVAGVAALGAEPAGAVAEGFRDRIIGVAFRLVQYGALTILLLYAGNDSSRVQSNGRADRPGDAVPSQDRGKTPQATRDPTRTLVLLLAWLFVLTVVGGLLGTFAGYFEFTSPFELLLPDHVRAKGFVKSLVHPQMAQIHDLVGDPMPRPAAPWGYTNTWGNNFCLLVGWFVVAVFGYAKGWVKGLALTLLVFSLVPVVHSLNRGLWIGLGVMLAYLAVRQALAGRAKALALAAATVALVAVAAVATPLGEIIERRLDNGKSNGVRMFLTQRALAGMTESPVLGFGTTRTTIGGRQSITVGESESCERCGNFTIGGNGQLWQLLFAHGLVGSIAYLGFFGYGLWRFRRDRTAIGVAGSAAIGSSFVAALWYNSLVTPLAFTFLAYVLLWRNDFALAKQPSGEIAQTFAHASKTPVRSP